MCTTSQKTNPPIRKAHLVGTSVVITIDPSHVKRLNIDTHTFFVQKPIKDGILLQSYKLTPNRDIDQRSDINWAK
jgi:hypothetical protein